MSPSQTPRVTVGIPVYNGEPYVRETIESVQKQHFDDLEILIADNASTDGTQDTLRHAADCDDRIRLILSDKNVGAAGNYNRVLAEAKGEYFAWLSADDLYEPAYIERAVEVLDQRPEVVGVYSHAGRIGTETQRLGDYRKSMNRLNLDHPDPATRFRSAVLGFPAIVLFGVMRREVMLDTPGHGAFIGGDRVFVSEMALKGRLARVDDELFQRRVHPQSYSALSDNASRAQWYTGEEAVPTNALRTRIGQHRAALRRAAPDRAALAKGMFALTVEFPCVLLKPTAVSLSQRAAQRLGRNIDYGRWDS